MISLIVYLLTHFYIGLTWVADIRLGPVFSFQTSIHLTLTLNLNISPLRASKDLCVLKLVRTFFKELFRWDFSLLAPLLKCLVKFTFQLPHLFLPFYKWFWVSAFQRLEHYTRYTRYIRYVNCKFADAVQLWNCEIAIFS